MDQQVPNQDSPVNANPAANQTPNAGNNSDSTNAPTGNGQIDEIMNLEPKDTPEIPQAELEAKKVENAQVDAVQEHKRLRWKCKNCGYQYEGYKKLQACPRCGKDPSYFEDVD